MVQADDSGIGLGKIVLHHKKEQHIEIIFWES